MRYSEFVKRVAEGAGFDSTEEADRATTATLSVLGERLKGGEPKDAGPNCRPSWPTPSASAVRGTSST
jgi:uncharacterized protein (DUF2267 family)